MPETVVYPAAADRIGFLDENAIDVITFYGLIELLRQKADELQRSRTPDEISSVVIHGLRAGFLDACVKGVEILPRFKTGVRRVDDRDVKVQRLVGESLRAHRLATRQRPKQDPLAQRRQINIVRSEPRGHRQIERQKLSARSCQFARNFA